MEFLTCFKEALSHGISKEDFIKIWEMKQKQDNTPITDTGFAACSEIRDFNLPNEMRDSSLVEKDFKYFIASETRDGTSDVKELDGKKGDNVTALLFQILEQQQKTYQQQIRIEEHLQHIQFVHNEHIKLQKQFDNFKDLFSAKFSSMENNLGNLEQSLTHSIKQNLQSESFDIQEKILFLTNHIYSHVFVEIKNLLHGAGEDTNMTSVKISENRQKHCEEKFQASDKISMEKPSEIDNKRAKNDCSSSDTVNSNDTLGDDRNKEMFQTNTDKAKDVNELISNNERTDSLKIRNIVCYELNSFLVSVQKLLLRPINSEDVSFCITDKMKELFQQERNEMCDQLLQVQTAISADIHARLFKMENNLKQDLQKNSLKSEMKKFRLGCKKMLDEMHSISDLLSTVKSVSVSGLKNSSDLGSELKNELDEVKEKIHKRTKEQTVGKQFNQEMFRKLKNDFDENDKNKANLLLEDNISEQIQGFTLILLMYFLTVLTYYDTIDRQTVASVKSNKLDNSEMFSTTSSDSKNLETKPKSGSSEKKRKSYLQKTDNPKELTDSHLKLMLGHHKQSSYLCILNYTNILMKDEYFLFENIGPGYNLKLKIHNSPEDKRLHFIIMSASGTQDESLIWPAKFSITVQLLDNKSQAKFEGKKWQHFTKIKHLPKPLRSTGCSLEIPFCYFREDAFNNLVDDDAIGFNISIQYLGGLEDQSQM